MSKKRNRILDQKKAEAKCGSARGGMPGVKVWFSTAEAAEYLGYSQGALRNARHVGLLAGVDPPAYKKFGRVCRYHINDLGAWSEQFESQSTTGAVA